MGHQNWQKMFYGSDKWLWIFGLKLWRSFQLRTTFSILSKTKSRNIPHSRAGLLYASSWKLGANGFHSLVPFDSEKHSHFCYRICMWFYNAPNMMSLFFFLWRQKKIEYLMFERSYIHRDRAVCTRVWFS